MLGEVDREACRSYAKKRSGEARAETLKTGDT